MMKNIALAMAMMLLIPACADPPQDKDKKVTPVPRSKVVQVRVLTTEGCVNTAPTIDRLSETAKRLNIPIQIEKKIVATQEQAIQEHFMGSPTVLVNGVDLDPSMRTNTNFGFS